MDGETYSFYDSSFSEKKREENYLNGKPHGQLKEFYENGTLKLLMNFENGELEGRVISYTKHNLPDEVIHYKKGKLHGALRKLNLKNDCSCIYWKTENYSNGDLINYYKYEFYGIVWRATMEPKNEIYIKRIDENGEERTIVLNNQQFNNYKDFPKSSQLDWNGDKEEYIENLFN